MAVRTKRKKGPSHIKRVQTVLTAEQYGLLVQAAKRAKKPVSTLIRESVEKGVLAQELHHRRERALKDLLSLDAPAPDWEKMEEEIIEGARGG